MTVGYTVSRRGRVTKTERRRAKGEADGPRRAPGEAEHGCHHQAPGPAEPSQVQRLKPICDRQHQLGGQQLSQFLLLLYLDDKSPTFYPFLGGGGVVREGEPQRVGDYRKEVNAIFQVLI